MVIPGERAKVLVTVKTYPTPSQNHVETVCVAGVRLDTPLPSWVRLYPIPFRSLGTEEQFSKWQMLDVNIRPRGTSDPRPESHAPILSTLTLGDKVDTKGNWKKRAALVSTLIGATSTCELIAANKAVSMAVGAPSIGLIKPRDIDVIAGHGKPWTKAQMEKARLAAEPDLFNAPLRELQPPPFEIRYKYRCDYSRCGGHDQMVLDWELGMAGIKWKSAYGPRTGEMIHRKWSEMVDPSRDIHFFVGNQHQHRQSFSVLGLWSPKL